MVCRSPLAGVGRLAMVVVRVQGAHQHAFFAFTCFPGPACRVIEINLKEVTTLRVATRGSSVRLISHLMSALPSAPPPLHIIRSHSSAVSALFISGDNERIYSGDISGLVVITSTRSLRPMASWKAHTDGLLGVEEWSKQVITSVCGSPLFECPTNPDAVVPSLSLYCTLKKATVATTSCTYGSFPRARRSHQPFADRHLLLVH